MDVLTNHFNESDLFLCIVADVEGKVLYANALARRKMGLPAKDAAMLTHLFGTKHLAQMKMVLAACVQQPYQKQWLVLPLKDTAQMVHIKWELSSNANQQIIAIGYEMQGTMEQSEKLVQLNASLKTLADTTSDINIILDTHFHLISFNKKAADFTRQFDGRVMHVGDDFRQYLLAPNDASFHEQFNEAIAGNRSIREIAVTNNNDTTWWYRSEMNPIVNDKGNITGVSINSTDVTHVQKTKQLLNEISWIQSHEIRKPLANIKGLVDLLSMEIGSHQTADITEIMAHLQASVNELDIQIRKIVNKAYEF